MLHMEFLVLKYLRVNNRVMSSSCVYALNVHHYNQFVNSGRPTLNILYRIHISYRYTVIRTAHRQ